MPTDVLWLLQSGNVNLHGFPIRHLEQEVGQKVTDHVVDLPLYRGIYKTLLTYLFRSN